jgi:hypothetical protein
VDRKEYLKNYQKNWLRKRKSEYFANKSCVKCNSTERLELDHIDPSKKITHSIWSRNQKFRDEELLKCQILCYKCHKEKSKQYCKELFSGKDNKVLQQISDDTFYKVIELNQKGLTLRNACKEVGIKYGTFSSTKSMKRRIFK